MGASTLNIAKTTGVVLLCWVLPNVYTNKNVIVQIEPSYNSYSMTTLLNDKGRQYFDSILKTWSEQEKVALTKEYWSKFFYAIIITVYVFDHC